MISLCNPFDPFFESVLVILHLKVFAFLFILITLSHRETFMY